MWVKLYVISLLSNYAFGHGTLHEQISHLTREIKKEPKKAELYLKRGAVYRDHREWARATGDFKKARELDPKLANIDLEEARLFFQSGRPEAAKESLSKYLRERNEDVHARYLRAKINSELKQWPEAVSDFSFVIERSQSPQPEMFTERAQAQMNAGMKEQAIAGLDEGLKRLGPLISLQEVAIQFELETQNYERAVQRVDSVLKTLNRKEQWLARRGDILEKAGRKTEAKSAYQDALTEIKRLPSHLQTSKPVVELRAGLEKKLAQP